MSKLPIPFNNPDTYPGHSGVDFGKPTGTPIPASADGYIYSRGYNNRAGHYAWVRWDGETPDTLYAHFVNGNGPGRGERISYGSTIGFVGSTGNSTGPHVHVEVEGYATTDGFWQWFDPNNVVGSYTPVPPTPSGDLPAPPEGEYNPFGITYSAGLQKISNIYGGNTAIDQKFGPRSMAGFAEFLRQKYGYVGNDELGPVMWAAIARWLRSRWGYVGNDVPGPVMRAALQRAETANYNELD